MFDPQELSNTEAQRQKWTDDWWFNISRDDPNGSCNDVCDLNNITDACGTCVRMNAQKNSFASDCLSCIGDKDDYDTLYGCTMPNDLDEVYFSTYGIIVGSVVLVGIFVTMIILKKNYPLVVSIWLIMGMLAFILIMQYVKATNMSPNATFV